ncbi:YncE family protein [Corynebacterium sp. HS2168-gen11]|uniref:YncE family protein n=1 Tax=Corynebacterium sp. HS2168-gen11 TaxID=2974027 RepID=UPI00216B4A6C|nr:YncE family protein [Corynebacterium sp. HS2168-gen11]MCS4535692.1 YncE family protein [Corynebacterium sp. HS2168-gen11]
MNNRLKSQAVQRAIAGFMAISLATSGAVVAAPLAHAQAETTQTCADNKPRAKKNTLKGDIEIVGASTTNFKAGGKLTIRATGLEARPDGYLVVKINANKNQWNEAAQAAGSGLKIQNATELEVPAALFPAGEFEVTVVLPQELTDGQHVISVLGGNDGNGPGFYHLPFKVDNTGANDGHCGTIAANAGGNGGTETPAPAEKSDAEVKSVKGYAAQDRRGYTPGQIAVSVEVPGFTAGATPTATIDGTAVDLNDAFHKKVNKAESVVVGKNGTFKAIVVLPKNSAIAGAHTLQITADGVTKDIKVVTDVYAHISENAAQGASTTVTVVNLPEGAKVLTAGIEGTNWFNGAVVADNHVVSLPNVKVPADAPFGAPVLVTYEHLGKTFTVETGTKVNAPQNAVALEEYSSLNGELPTGLYQSAVNDATGEVFVTGANRTANSAIYKLDAKTLEVKQTLDITAKDASGKGVLAAYGIGLDNKRGLIWVTNTRHNTVAVYKQSDLSLVKQFAEGTTPHPRDVVVDEATGKAYVSASNPRKTEQGDVHGIDVYDISKDAVETTIVLPGFERVMSLELDPVNGLLFTTAREVPKAAKVELHANNNVTVWDLPADKVDGASGVAYDPERKKLYIASQNSGNTVVLNAETGAVTTAIPTGANALNAHYNPADKRVYITNRGAGTVTVIDPATDAVVANLPAGKNANHVSVGQDGTIFVVNKSATAKGDTKVDQVYAYKYMGNKPGNNHGSSWSSLSTWQHIALILTGVIGALGALAAGIFNAIKTGKIPGFRLPF